MIPEKFLREVFMKELTLKMCSLIVDKALEKVSKQRADLGAYQNRLENVAKGLMVAYENTQASESRIRDADMAEEMVRFVRNQILTQSGTLMLAQANMKSQSVLRLLG